jgi:anti-anti-sigma factor
MIPLKKEDVGDVTVLRIHGELDFENTVWLRGELQDLLKKQRLKILLDLKDVDLISSYTVGVFVAFARDLREMDGDLKFLHLQNRVRQTFEATRIHQILESYNDEEVAVQSFETQNA